jgi:plastocyanin
VGRGIILHLGKVRMRFPRLALALIGFAIFAGQLAAPAAAPAQAQAVVPDNLVDFDFDPPQLVVPAGTTVVWTNVGPTPHTVAGTSGVGAGAAVLWTSDIMMTGDTYSFTFSAPGTYPIICTLHPNMIGTVIVQ